MKIVIRKIAKVFNIHDGKSDFGYGEEEERAEVFVKREISRKTVIARFELSHLIFFPLIFDLASSRSLSLSPYHHHFDVAKREKEANDMK